MGKHGPLFDEFSAQSGEHHGGAQHDEFHREVRANAGTDAVTETYRQNTAHPEWDERDWQMMPHSHGAEYDSNFDEPTALAGGDHGTWHDVFRGAQVRYIADGGHSYEGTVIRTESGHAVVARRDGQGEHEVLRGQIKLFRRAEHCGAPERQEASRDGVQAINRPADDTAAIPASPAEAPSAHDPKASGGRLRKSLDDTLADVRKLAGLPTTPEATPDRTPE
jgi:hypothetical protein